ncbi:helix-turn-helix domain-containing protein [Clostridium sp. SM-530-WT-3G]|uniref:AraC family transcriptional regulator n=1 Tax=Clostridium sp. SM-530-WT-3G TaxID=2725303 RepID=UPI001FAE2229|nr:helix-turn-helix domain-containing protein [Clostridium sp. SM-530-WT-3G]
MMNNLLNLKENTHHGDFILPFTTYHCEFSDSFSFVPIHWHKEMEITLIKKGQGIHKIDLNPLNVEEGDIVFVKPSLLHSIEQTANKDIMIWSTMVFNLNMLNSALTDGCLIKFFAPIFNSQNELPMIIRKDSPGYDDVLLTIKRIFECYDKKIYGFELELKSLLYHLFYIIYSNKLVKEKKVSTITKEVSDTIKLILKFIHENYEKDLSVEEIALKCNFSEYHFMRFFKKHIGMTCIEYINNYRLETASSLLSNTNKSILDISFKVGFNNVSYFNKLFKKKYNITPKEFRKSKRMCK